TSILTPTGIAAGSLRPANPRLSVVLMQLLMVFFLFPLMQAPTLLPFLAEGILEWLDWSGGLPVCLLFALVECALIVLIYRLILKWQGDMLNAREQRILETVTNRAT